ncbi:MAG: hypothetical protein AAFX40_09815 [Cyanobacteria bacterium J06639_1]
MATPPILHYEMLCGAIASTVRENLTSSESAIASFEFCGNDGFESQFCADSMLLGVGLAGAFEGELT